jgi:peptidoglycan/LPS O-acetylase OafA/YrhL
MLAMAGSYVLAFASYHLWEKHFLKLKQSFESQPAPAPAGLGPPEVKSVV